MLGIADVWVGQAAPGIGAGFVGASEALCRYVMAAAQPLRWSSNLVTCNFQRPAPPAAGIVYVWPGADGATPYLGADPPQRHAGFTLLLEYCLIVPDDAAIAAESGSAP